MPMKRDCSLPFFDMSRLAGKNPKPEVIIDAFGLSDAHMHGTGYGSAFRGREHGADGL